MKTPISLFLVGLSRAPSAAPGATWIVASQQNGEEDEKYPPYTQDDKYHSGDTLVRLCEVLSIDVSEILQLSSFTKDVADVNSLSHFALDASAIEALDHLGDDDVRRRLEDLLKALSTRR